MMLWSQFSLQVYCLKRLNKVLKDFKGNQIMPDDRYFTKSWDSNSKDRLYKLLKKTNTKGFFYEFENTKLLMREIIKKARFF